jgi:hypothetical protein
MASGMTFSEFSPGSFHRSASLLCAAQYFALSLLGKVQVIDLEFEALSEEQVRYDVKHQKVYQVTDVLRLSPLLPIIPIEK